MISGSWKAKPGKLWKDDLPLVAGNAVCKRGLYFDYTHILKFVNSAASPAPPGANAPHRQNTNKRTNKITPKYQ